MGLTTLPTNARLPDSGSYIYLKQDKTSSHAHLALSNEAQQDRPWQSILLNLPILSTACQPGIVTDTLGSTWCLQVVVILHIFSCLMTRADSY